MADKKRVVCCNSSLVFKKTDHTSSTYTVEKIAVYYTNDFLVLVSMQDK